MLSLWSKPTDTSATKSVAHPSLAFAYLARCNVRFRKHDLNRASVDCEECFASNPRIRRCI